MVCSQCHTPNFRDYKYCRECGTRLEVPEALAPVDDHAEVEELLQHAFVQMDQGETEKALATVQAALARDPESPSAHSTLGLVYERQGKIQEAIHQFRVVLQLSPDSSADRDKLQQLLARGGARETRVGGRSPLHLAVGSAVVAGVVTFGVGLFHMSTRPATARSDRELTPAAGSTAATSAPAAAQTPAPLPRLPQATVPPTSPMPAAMRPPSFSPAPAPAMALAPPSAPRQQSRPTPPAPWSARPVAQPGGLQPAAIGEVVPLARLEPTAQPAGAPAAAEKGPESRPQSKPRVEPLEPETGFIKIEPLEKGGQPSAGGPAGPAPAPAPEASKPSISITITPGR